jgi:hypothetical protein
MNLDKQLAYEANRIRRMDEMLENAERKLAGLYREAKRYNLALLDMPSAVDAAWERRVLLAKIEAAERGHTYTLEGL